MQLEFKINKQKITRVDKEEPVADSQNYLYAHFDFLTPEWDRISKKVNFFKNGNVTTVLLPDDNIVAVPPECLTVGHFYVSCFGGDRITNNIASVFVEKSGYADGEPPEEFQEDFYNTVQKIAENAVKTAQSVRDDADNGEFNGADGQSAYEVAVEQGYTGSEEEWIESLKGRGSQADYSQNDDTAEDYIKNRPFYKKFESYTFPNADYENVAYEYDGTVLYRISDEFPYYDYDKWNGSLVTAHLKGDEENRETVEIITEGDDSNCYVDIDEETGKVLAVAIEYFYILYTSLPLDEEGTIIVPEGVYLITETYDEPDIVVLDKIEIVDIKTIDISFIPKEIHSDIKEANYIANYAKLIADNAYTSANNAKTIANNASSSAVQANHSALTAISTANYTKKIVDSIPNIYATKEEIPSKTSELENDSDYATKEYVEQEIANFDFIKIVTVLPETGLVNRTYFVPKTDTETNDLYDEYMWVDGKWELVGTKQIEVDLTGYVKNTDYATQTKGGTIRTSSNFNIYSNGQVYCGTRTFSQYESDGNENFISKGTLENVITGKELLNKSIFSYDETTETLSITIEE